MDTANGVSAEDIGIAICITDPPPLCFMPVLYTLSPMLPQ